MELKFIVESILFSAQQPLAVKELRGILGRAVEHSEDPEVKTFKKSSVDEIEAVLAQLQQEHEQAQRSYRLACVAGSWQFVSQTEYAPWIKALVGHKARPPRLSLPALETLAIVAYRQPITRAEIEQVRGVAVDGVLQTLVERGLIEQVGRAEVVGRPMTYGTTELFLQYFGLGSLDHMPAADDLRRIPITKPEALLTVDAGLATAPPEQLRLGDSGRSIASDPPATHETPGTAESDAAGASARSAERNLEPDPPPEPVRLDAPETGIETAAPPASRAGSDPEVEPSAPEPPVPPVRSRQRSRNRNP